MRRLVLTAAALTLAACTAWRDPQEQLLPDGGVGVADMGSTDLGPLPDAGAGVDCNGATCATGGTCCVLPSAEMCVPSSSACAGGILLACDSPDDCAGMPPAHACCGQADGWFRCAGNCDAPSPFACASSADCVGRGGNCVRCPNAEGGHIDVCGTDVGSACPAVYALVSDAGMPDAGTPIGCAGTDCHVQCAGSSCDIRSNQVCCTGPTNGFCTTAVPTVCAETELFCDSDADCGSGTHCCFTPHTGGSGTAGLATCEATCSHLTVCTDGSQCGGAPCVTCPIGMGVSLGLCGTCPGGVTPDGGVDGGTSAMVQCGAVACSAGLACCVSATDVIGCMPSCPAGHGSLACDGPEDCTPGSPDCCWDAPTHTATCGTCLDPTRLCHVPGDCGAGSCTNSCTAVPGTTVTAGFCGGCPP